MFSMYLLFISTLGYALIVQPSYYASSHIIHVTNANISTLHQLLEDSHQDPLCVVHRTGSELERRIKKLFLATDGASGIQLSSWVLAAVDTTQVGRLPRYLLTESDTPRSSFLRCFLGPMLSHDFEPHGPPTAKQLQRWLRQLVVQYDQLANGSVDMIEASVSRHSFTLLVFPTAQEHEQLERVAFQVREALSTECKITVIVVHPSSTHLKSIVNKYKVFNVPSVLVIDKETGMERQQTLFNIHDVMTGRLETDLRARLVPARRFTLSDFKRDVWRVMPGERYTPCLIGFYAHWEKDSAAFLSFLRHTVEEFTSLGTNLRFGLVDAAHTPEVVSHFMSPKCLQHLPFLALFHAEEGEVTVSQTELLVSRPTPYTVYSALQEVGFILTDSHQQPISYQPYGKNTQVCLRKEGPNGDRCSSDNTTRPFYMDFVTSSIDKQSTQDTATDDKNTESLNTVPLATPADFHPMGKRSHSDADVYISIFIFIRRPCKSCEDSQPLFQHIYQQLSANDSHRVRLINCSRTPAPCQQHHVTGFPTLLAFRWHQTPFPCHPACSGKGVGSCGQSVRQDYHGALTVGAVMDWINIVSVSSVQHLHFSEPDWTRQKESAQLIATLVPLDSGFLPLPPRRDRGYFYSPRCFREVCERLFGLVACFTANSADIPPSEFDNEDIDFAIVQVDFRRRDGVEVTLMQLGHSLADVLDQETGSALHMFHTHHSYNLPRKQECEKDHHLCTQFLEAFARDHIRLPVTSLTSEILHSHNDFLFGKKVPVLLALVETDCSAEFEKVLQNIAYRFYKDVVVATLDVNAYRAWAGSFVPRDYNRLHAESTSWGELSVYPRLCVFYWQDHSKAAFYPPVMATTSSPPPPQDPPDLSATSSAQLLTEDSIAGFLQQFLLDPASYLVETERF